MNPSVTFVVPAFNEEVYIEATVKTIEQAVALSQPPIYEIILVNDGSTDDTGKIIDQLAASYKHVKSVHNPRNLGLGGAYKSALAVAGCDYLIIVAGDDVIPAASLALILDHVGEADILLTYMADAQLRPMGRRIAAWGFTTLINLLFGLRIKYYNSMVPRRELLNRITISTDSYAFQAEAIVKLIRLGHSHAQLGVPNTPCAKGHSSALRLKKLVQVLKGVVNLVVEIYRPDPAPTAKRNNP